MIGDVQNIRKPNTSLFPTPQTISLTTTMATVTTFTTAKTAVKAKKAWLNHFF